MARAGSTTMSGGTVNFSYRFTAAHIRDVASGTEARAGMAALTAQAAWQRASEGTPAFAAVVPSADSLNLVTRVLIVTWRLR